MRIRIVILILITIFMNAGCSWQSQPVELNKLTPNFIKPLATTTEWMDEPLATATETKTMVFDTAPGYLLTPAKIPSGCYGQSDLRAVKEVNAKGLVLYIASTKQLIVLGDKGIRDPLYTIESKSLDTILARWNTSPDGQWLSYLDFKRVDYFDVWIENIKTGEKKHKHFEGQVLGGYAVYWGNNEEIIIPLKVEGEHHQWIIWNPFTQNEQLISANLVGYDSLLEKGGGLTWFDVNTKTVVYPCKECGNNDYLARSLDGEEIIWSIDFGDGDPNRRIVGPYASPANQFFSLQFDAHDLWIMNFQGDSLLKVKLANDSNQNFIGSEFAWSYDNNYLAMFRERGDRSLLYISILNLAQKEMKNLCFNIGGGYLQWSYDNKHIAHLSSYYEGTSLKNTLSIIDVSTGQGEKMVLDGDALFVGWLKP